MSRLLMNMIQTEFGMTPSIVKKESRVSYITSLAETRDREDEEIFLRFMREHFVQNLQEQIEDYLKSQDEPLNSRCEPINEPLNLSEKELVILSLLRENSGITIAEMTELAHYSRSTVKRVLRSLQECGAVTRTGAKKNGHWEVIGSCQQNRPHDILDNI